MRKRVDRWGPEFPAALSCTAPAPVPAAPPAIVSQLVSLAAVHEHPPAAVTDTDVVPAVGPNETEAGATLNVQPDAWLTTRGCPATVSVATRCGPGFPAAVN